MLYLANAFSLQMVQHFDKCTLHVKKISFEECKKLLHSSNSIESVIGHESTAQAIETILNEPVPVNRKSIKVTKSDILIVFQFVGGRPPEGAVLHDINFLQKNMEVFLIDCM